MGSEIEGGGGGVWSMLIRTNPLLSVKVNITIKTQFYRLQALNKTPICAYMRAHKTTMPQRTTFRHCSSDLWRHPRSSEGSEAANGIDNGPQVILSFVDTRDVILRRANNGSGVGVVCITPCVRTATWW